MYIYTSIQRIAPNRLQNLPLFLTEKYFDMNKKNCKEGLDIYKKFITRMDRVSDFLKVAEDVGFDKDDIPDLSKVKYLLDDCKNDIPSEQFISYLVCTCRQRTYKVFLLVFLLIICSI